jgi:hypothetical protein
VRNRSQPEGSIAEAYVADECLTFCSKYMDDVDTKFNQEPRNKDFSDEEAYGVDVFGNGVNFTSASEPLSEDSAIDQMLWFVLNNCSQVEKYMEYVLITLLCSVVFYFCHAHLLILLKKLQNVHR